MGHQGVTQLLLDSRADPYVRDKEHSATALTWAEYQGRLLAKRKRMLQELLAKQPDIEIPADAAETWTEDQIGSFFAEAEAKKADVAKKAEEARQRSIAEWEMERAALQQAEEEEAKKVAEEEAKKVVAEVAAEEELAQKAPAGSRRGSTADAFEAMMAKRREKKARKQGANKLSDASGVKAKLLARESTIVDRDHEVAQQSAALKKEKAVTDVILALSVSDVSEADDDNASVCSDMSSAPPSPRKVDTVGYVFSASDASLMSTDEDEDMVSVLTVQGEEFEFTRQFLDELDLDADQLKLLTIDQCFLLANYAAAHAGLGSSTPLPYCLQDHSTLHGLDVTKLDQTRVAAQIAGYKQLTEACDQAETLLSEIATSCDSEKDCQLFSEEVSRLQHLLHQQNEEVGVLRAALKQTQYVLTNKPEPGAANTSLESAALERGITVFTSLLGNQHSAKTDRIELICAAIGAEVGIVERPELRKAAPEGADLPLVMVDGVVLAGGFEEFQEMHDDGWTQEPLVAVADNRTREQLIARIAELEAREAETASIAQRPCSVHNRELKPTETSSSLSTPSSPSTPSSRRPPSISIPKRTESPPAISIRKRIISSSLNRENHSLGGQRSPDWDPPSPSPSPSPSLLHHHKLKGAVKLAEQSILEYQQLLEASDAEKDVLRIELEAVQQKTSTLEGQLDQQEHELEAQLTASNGLQWDFDIRMGSLLASPWADAVAAKDNLAEETQRLEQVVKSLTAQLAEQKRQQHQTVSKQPSIDTSSSSSVAGESLQKLEEMQTAMFNKDQMLSAAADSVERLELQVDKLQLELADRKTEARASNKQTEQLREHFKEVAENALAKEQALVKSLTVAEEAKQSREDMIDELVDSVACRKDEIHELEGKLVAAAECERTQTKALAAMQAQLGLHEALVTRSTLLTRQLNDMLVIEKSAKQAATREAERKSVEQTQVFAEKTQRLEQVVKSLTAQLAQVGANGVHLMQSQVGKGVLEGAANSAAPTTAAVDELTGAVKLAAASAWSLLQQQDLMDLLELSDAEKDEMQSELEAVQHKASWGYQQCAKSVQIGRRLA